MDKKSGGKYKSPRLAFSEYDIFFSGSAERSNF
jgi:hypothetical protein